MHVNKRWDAWSITCKRLVHLPCICMFVLTLFACDNELTGLATTLSPKESLEQRRLHAIDLHGSTKFGGESPIMKAYDMT